MRSSHFRNDSLSNNEFFQGTMQKLRPKLISYWQTRYFVLKFRMLRYYKSEADMKAGKPPRGILNF